VVEMKQKQMSPHALASSTLQDFVGAAADVCMLSAMSPIEAVVQLTVVEGVVVEGVVEGVVDGVVDGVVVTVHVGVCVFVSVEVVPGTLVVVCMPRFSIAAL
jgi:hypothetical protein